MQLSEMMKMQPQKFAREINRLGLGSYKDGNHSPENWQISRSAAAYLKMNGIALEKQYRETGQQSAIEFLARIADTLERHYGIDSELVKTIKNRSGGQADAGKIIASTPDFPSA